MGAPRTLRPCVAARANAIENMAAHLKAVTTVLVLDYKRTDKIVWAMDLGLFLSNPDQYPINTFLENAVPNVTAGDFGGDAASIRPYLEKVKLPNAVDNVPISCWIIQTYSELFQAEQTCLRHQQG